MNLDGRGYGSGKSKEDKQWSGYIMWKWDLFSIKGKKREYSSVLDSNER